MIGCVVYGCGSLITSLSRSLPVLIFGWSFLEGLGGALIMPAVVALVATNFASSERPRAYGLVASAGAIAVAVGPLVGGLLTTYASWRWVFAGEVVIVLGILALSRLMVDCPAVPGVRISTPSAPSCRQPAWACWCTACSAPARGASCSRSPRHRCGSGCHRSCG